VRRHVAPQLVVALVGVRLAVDVVLGLLRQQRLIAPAMLAHAASVDTGSLGPAWSG
jgi:hypothetical protein